MVGRIVLAAVLGGLIGLERESSHRPAGFRTHILVSVGSALVMLISMYGFADFERTAGFVRDPARLAAQVVSGIGFLGAGTIMREGATVRGLTTAASLWVVSGIGLAAGAGFYFGAAVATALVVVVLLYLSRVERRVFYGRVDTVEVVAEDVPGQLGKVGSELGQLGINIRKVALDRDEERGLAIITVDVPHMTEGQRATVIYRVAAIPGIISVTFQSE